MALSYLDKNGVAYLWGKIKSIIPKKTSDLTNDSNFPVDANYHHTDNNYTTAEKNKLASIKQCYIDQTAHIIEMTGYYEMKPYYVTFSAKNMENSSAYSGRFVIEDTVDNVTWQTAYTSSTDESSVTYYYAIGIRDEDDGVIVDEHGQVISGNYKKPKQVRCSLYEAGGTTRKLAVTYAITQIDGSGLNAKINSMANVQANWDEASTSSDAFIKNKPTKLSQFQNDVGFKTYDNNTTYTLTKSQGVITLTDSNGVTWSVTDDNTVYTHPSHTAHSSGFYKITVDNLGHVTAVTPVTKADITALGIPGSDTTYTNATSSKAGLMSAADKAALDVLKTLLNKKILIAGDATT